jgi:hypothetical protein
MFCGLFAINMKKTGVLLPTNDYKVIQHMYAVREFIEMD